MIQLLLVIALLGLAFYSIRHYVQGASDPHLRKKRRTQMLALAGVVLGLALLSRSGLLLPLLGGALAVLVRLA
ncbi:MAG: hypothetical protein ACR2HF_10780, partial [Methylococcaceae bacterium]